MKLTSLIRRAAGGALVVVLIAIGVGCGSGSGDSTSGATSSSSAAAAPSGTSGYRAAVNKIFNEVVAARGHYQAAHGDAALRRTALALARADQAGLAKLRGLDVPSGAKALQTQLATSLGAQAAALKTVLGARKLDTAKLGDAVLASDDAERVVAQINALP